MPTPSPDETRADWMARCVPEVLEDGAADDDDQAVAMCAQMWRDREKGNTMLNFGIPIEIKDFRADDDEWVVEGYASTFGNQDLGDDVVERGAFDRTLKSGRRVAFLSGHDPRLVLGKPKKLDPDKKGLGFAGRISKTQLGRDTRELIMDDAMGGFSIGYMVPEGGAKYDEDGRIRRLVDVDLYEVSVVAMPMNEQAVITGVKDYWPGMTLAEKAQALAGALDQLLSDTRSVAQAGPGPLNQTKRQELEALLEMLSGLDAARSDLQSVLTAASHPKMLEQWELRQRLEQLRSTLT